MIVRLAVLVLCLGVVLPAVLGSAASFSIAPLVSQEVHIPIEEVVTSERLGGAEFATVSNSVEESTNDEGLPASSPTEQVEAYDSNGSTDAPDGYIDDPQGNAETTEHGARRVPAGPVMVGPPGNVVEPRPTATPTPIAISISRNRQQ